MSRDRGYGTAAWLLRLSRYGVRFVVRWKKGNKLIDDAGCAPFRSTPLGGETGARLSHPPSFMQSGWRPYRPLSHLTWPPCSLRWWMTLWHQIGFLF